MIGRALLLTACILTAVRATAAQETQRCSLDGAHQTTVKLPSGQYNAFFGGGVSVNCQEQSLRLTADSLERYGDEGKIFFLGNVHYDEPRLSLTSNYLTYHQRDERVVATGNVNARLPSGSTLRGPMAEYYRAIPGTRPEARLLATGRPTISIAQKDSAGAPAPHTTVLANQATMIGDSLVYAGGSVLVTREEVVARGDSMTLDSEREITIMIGRPSIEGRRERPFRLSGDRIELLGRNRELDRVIAKGRATAASEDMTLTSDTIELHVADDLLQRAIAWGPSRARASSPAQQIVSDSIDVSMPNQRIREMHAVGTALAQGKPDTSRFRADTLDWMRGDTIVARFDTTTTVRDTTRAGRDTTRAGRDTTRTQLDELVAVGNARSYYHLPPSDTTVREPAINYVTGREIMVDFREQRVARVTVVDQAAGVYLEPRPAAATSDTTRAAIPAAPPPPGYDARGATRGAADRARATGSTPSAAMTDALIQSVLDQLGRADRSPALALHALLSVAREDGTANFNEAATVYREDHLAALRAAGRDAEREAGRLGLDQVRDHLAHSVFPRLAGLGLITLPPGGLLTPDAVVRFSDDFLRRIQSSRAQLAEALRRTGEHAQIGEPLAEEPSAEGSLLEAFGLVKMYRRRRVVNDVALRLQQGEIVGLLGPNGAGKTTTFYMIVGLIPPMAGRILLDGQDITAMPMYQRARLGIGYLSQEPSVFRKLSVEDNILAILETLPISAAERRERLERLLDELSIKHLRSNKAFSLSGGERRRLEITRALVTQPKFMMLDEPFAGVDPIAVHDIQQIVGNLRTRNIGVLISDHNVEQTLDIVDRAYIMFDGQVKVSGSVRELVFDDTVADIYLGPTLTARLRSRFSASHPGSVSVAEQRA